MCQIPRLSLTVSVNHTMLTIGLHAGPKPQRRAPSTRSWSFIGSARASAVDRTPHDGGRFGDEAGERVAIDVRVLPAVPPVPRSAEVALSFASKKTRR